MSAKQNNNKDLFQFMVGFFSFLLLLCCESATASFRASLVPIHSTFGISTFVLAVAAACSGLTEKAFFSLRYVELSSCIHSHGTRCSSCKSCVEKMRATNDGLRRTG